MHEKRILKYKEKEACHKNSIVKEIQEDKCQKKDYYVESMNALISYMENNEMNPSESRWNKYAICKKYLSSKTLGYLSGIGFNTLCRKIRKELNKKKRQIKD